MTPPFTLSCWIRNLFLQQSCWSWPTTGPHLQYEGHRVTYANCVRTGRVRLCCPVELRILSAREDRQIRKDMTAYLKLQSEVDASHIERRAKAWNALLNHRRAMEKRNATLVTVASARV
jgi:hypothetical protein